MTNRIPLTKALASQLLKKRRDAGVSQYELADQLGWVRSKIKRIEKAEVASIETQDLSQLERALGNVQGGAAVSVSRAKPVIAHLAGKIGNSTGCFSDPKPVQRRMFKNLKFFQVSMTKQVQPGSLLGSRIELQGVRGRVQGVEATQDQYPLREGDQVVIAVRPS